MNFDLKKLAPWNWFKKEQETAAGARELPVLKTASDPGLPSLPAMQTFYDLHRQMDRLFAEAFRGFGFPATPIPTAFSGMFRPSLDIEETEKDYRITLEIPGVDENDFQLVVDERVLYIRGEKRREEIKSDRGYHCIERSYGSFQRALNLPADADEDRIKASFKNGVLTVKVDKLEGKPKSPGKTIPIESA